MQPTFLVGMMILSVEVGNVHSHSDFVGMGSLVMSSTGCFPSRCWAFVSGSSASDIIIC